LQKSLAKTSSKGQTHTIIQYNVKSYLAFTFNTAIPVWVGSKNSSVKLFKEIKHTSEPVRAQPELYTKVIEEIAVESM
jgi:hypothetical protein